MLAALEGEVQSLVDRLRRSQQPTPPPPEESEANQQRLKRALKGTNARVESLQKTVLVHTCVFTCAYAHRCSSAVQVDILQDRLRTLQVAKSNRASGDNSSVASASSRGKRSVRNCERFQAIAMQDMQRIQLASAGH